MQNATCSVATVGDFGLGVPLLLQVGRSQRIYLNADAGVALVDDVTLGGFILPTAGVKLKLDAGPQLSVAGVFQCAVLRTAFARVPATCCEHDQRFDRHFALEESGDRTSRQPQRRNLVSFCGKRG